MKKEKGFTLIELLAVIIILTIIALISVPLILNIIEKARKSAFQNSAYGIMESARLYYVENIIDNKELGDKVFSYEEEENELKYKGTRPKGGTIIVKSNGKIEMSIYNEKWCAIKREDKESIEIIDYNKETCKIESPMIEEGIKLNYIESGFDSAIPGSYYNIRNQKGMVTCINLSDDNKEVTNTKELKEGENCVKCRMIYENKEIASLTRTFMVKNSIRTFEEVMNSEAVGENGIIRTDTSGNKRYAGSNPNNYVCFGTDETTCSGKQLWRIIGVIDGNLKLISTEYYKNAGVAWDRSGYNIWTRPASLNTALQNDIFNNTEWINSEDQKEWMLNNKWKFSGKDNDSDHLISIFETAEKDSEYTTSNSIGLMTVTDFAYGTSDNECTLDTDLRGTNTCFNSNWLATPNRNEWTFTLRSDNQNNVFFIYNGIVSFHYAYYSSIYARPAVILDSNVKIKNGTGTESDPYILTK